jgi:hypothetical protein
LAKSSYNLAALNPVVGGKAVFILLLHLVPGVLANDASTELRYLRPVDGRWVLESEVRQSRTADGAVYESVTHRPGQKMTLRLFYDGKRRVTAAEIIHEAKSKNAAKATFKDGTARLVRDGKEEVFKLSAEPVVTTAPDWSDIFLLARRYDRSKGGRQEFAGFWFHPQQPARLLTFAVERLGDDTVRMKDSSQKLGRYRITLRSGAYLVWADDIGRVYKLIPAGNPKAAVVLEGYEEATAPLK